MSTAKSLSPYTTLKKKIHTKTARVAVMGLGYVGLPLALTIRDAGFFVFGIDTDEKKVYSLLKGISYIDDIGNDVVKKAISSKQFKPTTDSAVLKQVDVVIIAVPTPLDEYKTPDLTYVKKAAETVAKYLHEGELIVLESTTYPGTTEEVVWPILQQKFQTPPYAKASDVAKAMSDKSGGKQTTNYKLPTTNYFLAFSPERVDPGNKEYYTSNTPKVVGGINPRSGELATLFYKQFIQTVVQVTDAKTAEMVKLLENIFRIVNISLINELALLCDKMGIDIWEVVNAAATKPYGFMPFYPGPGIGGHCIAVDPFYLSYKAKKYGFFTRFIDLAGEINEQMPHHVVTKIITALNYSLAKSINKSKILMLGVSYKRNIKDTRESAAFKIASILQKKGARLAFFDPYIETFMNDGVSIPKVKALTQSKVREFDLAVILTDHDGIDYNQIAKWARVVVDTRNAIQSREYKNVYRL